MNFSSFLSKATVAAVAASLSLVGGSVVQAESLQLADSHGGVSPTQPTGDPMNTPGGMTEPTEDPMNVPGSPTEPTGDPMTAPADGLGNPAGSQTAPSSRSMTLVELASSNGSFNTLVQAVQAAGLANTLAGEGPYTVFAPTDAAFSELPDGVLEALLQPENQDLLVAVLSYHVVPGRVTSDQLSSGGVSTLNGGVAVGVSADGIVINNASVITPDLVASNGVIHSINRVLIPEALKQQLATELGVEATY